MTQIESYLQSNNTHNQNPCIPIPFNSNQIITITFNQQITSNHWYPLFICHAQTTWNYQNEYIFDGGLSMTLNNIILNNYYITNISNYPIVRSSDHYNGTISINNGIFTNITSISESNPLFDTMASIYIHDAIFKDISTRSHLISSH